MKTNLAFRTEVVPAYQTLQVAMTGSVFFCKTASAPFKLSIDGNSFLDWDQGFFHALPSGEFRTVLLRNESAADLQVSYYVGTGSIQYFPPITIVQQIVKNAPTYTKGTGILALNALVVTAYTGLDGTKVRKQFVVANLDINLNLHVRDQNGVVMGIVFPQQSWTIETSGALQVYNPNGVAVNYCVAETFYAG